MRSRLIIIGVGVVVVAGVAVFLTTRGGGEQTASTHPTKTFTVGAIEVKVAPHHINPDGAMFKVTLDTHSTNLDMALAGRLEVGGVAWEGGTWTGDGPTGHHRAGELAFQSVGDERGLARLTITGFPQPLIAEWML